GSTDRYPAVLGDLGRDVSDTADVKVAMFAGETKLGRQMLADMIAVKKRNRPAANFEELDHENVRNGRFAGTGQTSEKDGEPLLMTRRESSPEFLYNFRISKPVGDQPPFVQPLA